MSDLSPNAPSPKRDVQGARMWRLISVSPMDTISSWNRQTSLKEYLYIEIRMMNQAAEQTTYTITLIAMYRATQVVE